MLSRPGPQNTHPTQSPTGNALEQLSSRPAPAPDLQTWLAQALRGAAVMTSVWLWEVLRHIAPMGVRA